MQVFFIKLILLSKEHVYICTFRVILTLPYINTCILITNYHLTKISPVVPNRGAINDTQGCREIIHFSICHYKHYFQNVIKP